VEEAYPKSEKIRGIVLKGAKKRAVLLGTSKRVGRKNVVSGSLKKTKVLSFFYIRSKLALIYLPYFL
jgi:hypothetical protein